MISDSNPQNQALINIGNNIRRARRATGIKQKELAAQIGCTANTFRNLEKGVASYSVDLLLNSLSALKLLSNVSSLTNSDVPLHDVQSAMYLLSGLLKNLRVDSGLTQSQMAHQLNTKVGSIQKIENGNRSINISILSEYLLHFGLINQFSSLGTEDFDY